MNGSVRRWFAGSIAVACAMALPAVRAVAEPAAPRVSVGAIKVLEPDSASIGAFVPLSLSAPLPVDVRVGLYTVAESASGGHGTNDFQITGSAASMQYVTIPAGSVWNTIGVSVFADAVTEPDETFSVHVGSVTAADARPIAVGDADGTVTIVDNYRLSEGPLMMVTDVWTHEGDSVTRGNRSQFAIEVSAPLPAAVTLTYRTVDGTATGGPAAAAGIDYRTVPATTLTLPAGFRGSKTLDIGLYGDLVVEDPETFQLQVVLPDGAPVVQRDPAGTAVIINDDVVAPGAPTGVLATAGSAKAGDSSVTVTWDPPASDGGAPITSYTVTAVDATTPANGGQTVATGTSPAVVTGLVAGDQYTFTVTATNTAGTGGASDPSNRVTPLAACAGAPSLVGANLSGCNIYGSLAGADLTEANLAGAGLWYVNLAGATLTDADLTNTRLDWADLSGAAMSGADLRGAYLRFTGLADVDLTYADLRWTRILDTAFAGTDLTGALTNDSTIFMRNNLIGSTGPGTGGRIWWISTTCVDGSFSDDRPGYTCAGTGNGW